jgi:hypothetical protein
MFTVTVPRSDVTGEEVCTALRRGLGPRYHVLPGMRMNLNPVGGPQPDQPKTITVGTGSNRLFRAQVSITRISSHTSIRVSSGGLTLVPVLVNTLGVARKVRRVLLNSPELRPAG